MQLKSGPIKGWSNKTKNYCKINGSYDYNTTKGGLIRQRTTVKSMVAMTTTQQVYIILWFYCSLFSKFISHSNLFDSERTWWRLFKSTRWRLFKKRVVHCFGSSRVWRFWDKTCISLPYFSNEQDIYVFIFIILTSTVWCLFIFFILI